MNCSRQAHTTKQVYRLAGFDPKPCHVEGLCHAIGRVTDRISDRERSYDKEWVSSLACCAMRVRCNHSKAEVFDTFCALDPETLRAYLLKSGLPSIESC